MTERKPKKTSLAITEAIWDRMEIEYATTETSFRQLADKYGASYNRVQKYAKEHEWQKSKDAYRLKSLDKSIDLVADYTADRITRALRIGDKILDKIEESLDQLNVVILKESTTQRSYEKDEEGNTIDKSVSKEDFSTKEIEVIDRSALRQITGALKDLREIGIFRAELDRKEQEARINKLKKEAEDEQIDKTITIQIAADVDEYAD